eukprot:CAMPEP_0118875170 /NCGR_PEP_ID=MMETSP1163-20130328/16331_1 /TAXON_ID=124430 /ORGANISM="Phaeomonas parva, Strain CCMP2877" /LENGTH=400 /DNA_ID=CAMNT_0006810631 /DNA_START=8 /DNA_END=1207 /DNA_ORIENTATION=+
MVLSPTAAAAAGAAAGAADSMGPPAVDSPASSSPPPAWERDAERDLSLRESDLIGFSNHEEDDADAAPRTEVTKASIRRTRGRVNKYGSRYTVYVVEIRVATGHSWRLERRYSEFAQFHADLLRVTDAVADFTFPPKKWFYPRAPEVIAERENAFQEYLGRVITIKPLPDEVDKFLEVAPHLRRLHRILNGDVDLSSHAAGGRRPSWISPGMAMSARDFELLKVIGRGSFGKVFLVRPIGADDEVVYAMKVLKKSEIARRNQIAHTLAERHIMAKMSHPFIAQLRYAFQSRDKVYLVTDYYEGGDIFFHLKRLRHFPERMIQFYAAQMVLALQHLHSSGVIYRDLKPENILLDARGHIRLTDFGLSKESVTYDEGTHTFCGTPEYLAPEMLLHRAYAQRR